jgi:hypothetical protein
MLTLYPRETKILLSIHVSARETVLTHAAVIARYQATYHCNKMHKRGLLSCTLHNVSTRYIYFFFIWFVRLLALRPLLAYCASLG